MIMKIGDTEVIKTVLPGDKILDFDPDVNKSRVFVGPGLRWQDNVIRATRPGVLMKASRDLYYVDSHQKRYIPQRREFVIGIVLKKKGDNYIIDIGASEHATISYLSFENASKKTRTEMKPGDLLYGQLLVANKDMEPELVCIDVYDRAVGMGPLPEAGIMFTIPLHVARSIVNPENPILMSIAKRIKYTIIVGFNGRVWINAQNQNEMFAIMNCLSMLEVMPQEEVESNLMKVLDSFLMQRYRPVIC